MIVCGEALFPTGIEIFETPYKDDGLRHLFSLGDDLGWRTRVLSRCGKLLEMNEDLWRAKDPPTCLVCMCLLKQA